MRLAAFKPQIIEETRALILREEIIFIASQKMIESLPLLLTNAALSHLHITPAPSTEPAFVFYNYLAPEWAPRELDRFIYRLRERDRDHQSLNG